MVDLITVTGTIRDVENHTLGGRHVVGMPSPQAVATVEGNAVSLFTDAWTRPDGTFELVCVRVPGTIYTIQTRPERLLPHTLELRCNDWPASSIVPLASLPQAAPTTPLPTTTIAELQAALQLYINTHTRSQLPFADTRAAVTPGVGTMGLPNAMGRALTITEVALYAQIAPTGDDLVVDVNRNGTTIFTDQAHRPRVPAGAFSGMTTAIDNAAFAQGDVLTVDIDQVGSSGAGGHLTVVVTVQG